MYRSKLISVLMVLMMLAVPLMAMDMNNFGSSADVVDGSDAQDDRWNYVGDSDGLKAALSNGGNIQLANDISGVEQLSVSKKTILNLGGHTLTSAAIEGQSAITVACEVTIENGTISVNGCNGISVTGPSADAMLILLTINHVDGTGTSSAVSCVNGGKLTIQNGTYNSDATSVSLENGGGSVTINDGSFSSVRINADVAGDYRLKVLVGTIGNYSATGTAGDVEARFLYGTFNSSVEATYGQTNVYGGRFANGFDAESTGYVRIFAGEFESEPISEQIQTGSKWDSVTKQVYQTDSIHVGQEYYRTLEEALTAASATDPVHIEKTGTYFMGNADRSGMTIIGNENEEIVVFFSTPNSSVSAQADGGASANGEYIVDISNVTLYFTNDIYRGFMGASEERYTNVTFWGLIYLYSFNLAKFDNCTFNQYYNTYSINNYGTNRAEFNGCTFNSVGKSLLLYVDLPKEYPGGDVYLNDTTFVDHGLLCSKAAIEIHSEWGEIPDYSWWRVFIDEETSVDGFYKHTACENNLFNAVNNYLDTLSNTTEVYIGGTKFFPAVYDVELLGADGSIFRTIKDVTYGQNITKEPLPELPTKSGFQFAGYYDEMGITKYFDADGNCVRPMDVRETLKLYPHWTSEQKHTITYDINGGTGTVPAAVELNEGNIFQVATDENFGIEGYVFVGWSDGYKTYKVGTEYVMGASDLVLKAVWSKTVTPYVYRSVTLNVSVMHNGALITDDKSTIRIGSYENVTEAGRFEGIPLESKIYTVVVKLDRYVSCVTKTVDLTKSAEGSVNELEVEFDDYTVRTSMERSEGSDIEMAVGDEINDLAKKVKDESDAFDVEIKIFVDNSVQKAIVDKEQLDMVKALSDKSECTFFDITLKLSVDGKVSMMTETGGTVIEIMIPFDISGKSIELWHCHDGMAPRQFENNESGEDGTFYCRDGMLHLFTDKFSAFAIMSSESGTHTVFFDVDGGSVDVEKIGNIVNGKQITLPTYDGVKEGYTFGGWEYQGEVYMPGDVFDMPDSDVTFKAVWEKNVVPEVSGSDLTIAILLAVFTAIVCLFVIGTVFGSRTKH